MVTMFKGTAASQDTETFVPQFGISQQDWAMAPFGQKLPGRQRRHVEAPVSFWNVPVGHASHWPLRGELTKKPAEHAMALADPRGQKKPSGQSVHSLALPRSVLAE